MALVCSNNVVSLSNVNKLFHQSENLIASVIKKQLISVSNWNLRIPFMLMFLLNILKDFQK